MQLRWPPQQVEILPILKGSQDLAFCEDNDAKYERLCLVTTPKPLAFAQQDSEWNTRGWILQERLLASRNIYFSSTQVYFQCNEHVQCETTLEVKFDPPWQKFDSEAKP
ncbi:MAG: hypothetical protein LQ342_004768 [Letrouitia transgressa]|nr:MAG: hypothetical protein LQ342_004768 [Letrouitia transgressa]